MNIASKMWCTLADMKRAAFREFVVWTVQASSLNFELIKNIQWNDALYEESLRLYEFRKYKN